MDKDPLMFLFCFVLLYLIFIFVLSCLRVLFFFFANLHGTYPSNLKWRTPLHALSMHYALQYVLYNINSENARLSSVLWTTILMPQRLMVRGNIHVQSNILSYRYNLKHSCKTERSWYICTEVTSSYANIWHSRNKILQVEQSVYFIGLASKD